MYDKIKKGNSKGISYCFGSCDIKCIYNCSTS